MQHSARMIWTYWSLTYVFFNFSFEKYVPNLINCMHPLFKLSLGFKYKIITAQCREITMTFALKIACVNGSPTKNKNFKR